MAGFKKENTMIQKQGNNYSNLLKSIAKIAEGGTPPAKPSFDAQIAEALKGAAKPSLQEIIADISRGKNVHRTAQFNSPMPMAKPMDSPLDNLGGDLGGDLGGEVDPVGDIEGGGIEDELGGIPGEEGIPGEDAGGDVESATRNLAQALVNLKGPDGAKQAVEECCGGGEDLGGDLEGLEGEGDIVDDFGPEEVPFEDSALDEPAPMPMQPKPMSAPSAPQQMPGLV